VRGRTGLSSEIVVNITLLTAAALLFAGFLLISLTERELIAQRIGNLTGIMEVVARAVSDDALSDDFTAADLIARAEPLFRGVTGAATGMDGWGVLDRELRPWPAPGVLPEFRLEMSSLSAARLLAEPVVHIRYPSLWRLPGAEDESHMVVTIPVLQHGRFAGALQARFPLSEVRQRVQSAQRLMLLYAVLYGAVLVLFSVYFLRRAVVRPIRLLQSMAQRIAAGDLEQIVPVEGPREIADLAGSFNGMTAALRESQREREAHIQSLQQTNEELRQTQNELIRAEKMASVGHLAAGMAHEIGNPLGAVVGYLEFLKGESMPVRESEIIERALAEAGRIDRLVRELLDYAAPGGRAPQIFDPVLAIAEARDILLLQGAFDGLVLDDRLPPSLSATFMVRHQLVQVFINLLLNARDVSAAGGAICLAGGEEEGFVWLSVADAGAGMNPETLAHIFDPFFTTKAPGKGRGLGLAVCQRVVGEAGGRIDVRSAPGAGSEFRVWLKKAETAGHDA
jgi:signal transduction histidine kinase